jgi:MFS family permease
MSKNPVPHPDASDLSPLASPWRALGHRNFALFFTGHGLSLCGTWMQTLAQAWLVYRLTSSPFMLGLVEFLARGPVLVFGIAGGILADRWPRRRLMLVTQSLLLLQAIVLAGLTLTNVVTIEWVLGLALCMGLISAVEVPTRQAFVTDLVPRADIPSAIGMNSSLFNTARIIGPSLAGVVVAVAGEGWCFVLNALSFLLVIGCVAAMQFPVRPTLDHPHPFTQLKEGLVYAWHTPHVRAVLSLATIMSIASMPYSTLLPVFAQDVLHTGAQGLGLLMAATGVGALAAAFRHAHRHSIQGIGSSMAGAVVLFGLGMVGLASSRTLWLSVLALVLVGYGMVSSLAGGNILLQSLAPEGLRGRVVSLYATVSLGMTIFGSLLAGSGASAIGAPITVAIGGVVTVLAAALFWSSLPAIRQHLRAQDLAGC